MNAHKKYAVVRGLFVAALAVLLAPGAFGADGTRETLKSGSFSLELPLGLQADSAYIPDDNPMTQPKIDLGKLLYFDPRLSRDNTISCATCHNPYHGFTDPKGTSGGVGGAFGTRSSPTVINRLFSKEQFWDGRAEDLEEQAHGPLTNPVEMGMPSHDHVAKNVSLVRGYRYYFENAFGTNQVTIKKIAEAIAAYERTVLSGNSPFDRYMAGQKDAMSPSAVRGMDLFNGKANCKTCHAGFNFTDESYHNLGVGMDKPNPDLGRFEVTKAETEKGAFKTPTLRNITETAPYMHDGSEPTLRATVEFYNKGGVKNEWLAEEIKPLNLTDQEIGDIVAFMQSLTGEITNAVPPESLPK